MFKQKRIIRLISCLTLMAFFYSSVLHQTVYGIVANAKDVKLTKKLKDKINEFVLPSGFGRIVNGKLNNNENLVIYVQDLHCHSEVQRNISKIIQIFDEKYGINKVFVEGAPKGKVDTCSFCKIDDKDLRKAAIETLMDKGLLGGAEYYSLTENKDKIFGIEDWNIYLENIKRINKLFKNKEQNKAVTQSLNDKILRLKHKYLSKKIKKLEKYFNTHVENKTKGEKYYIRLAKLAEKTDENINAYPNLAKYIEIIHLKKEVRFKRVANELRQYINDLKKVLPYMLYQELAKKLNKRENFGEYYHTLYTISQEYNHRLEKQYPSLAKFLKYHNLSHTIHPLYLIEEEKTFANQVMLKKVNRLIDKELLFLSACADIFDNFVQLKLASKEYEYFKENKNKFKVLLEKYLFNEDISKELNLLKNEELYAYYDANLARNDIFVENVVAQSPKFKVKRKEVALNLEPSALSTKISDFSDIFVVVAGGFHGEISTKLDEKGISYLIITPNVTQEFDDTLYEQIMMTGIGEQTLISSALDIAEIKWPGGVTLSPDGTRLNVELLSGQQIVVKLDEVGKTVFNSRIWIKEHIRSYDNILSDQRPEKQDVLTKKLESLLQRKDLSKIINEIVIDIKKYVEGIENKESIINEANSILSEIAEAKDRGYSDVRTRVSAETLRGVFNNHAQWIITVLVNALDAGIDDLNKSKVKSALSEAIILSKAYKFVHRGEGILSNKYAEKWLKKLPKPIRIILTPPVRIVLMPLVESLFLVPVAIMKVVWPRVGKRMEDWFIYKAHDNLDEADVIIRQQGMAWITVFTWIGLALAILAPILGLDIPMLDFVSISGTGFVSILLFSLKAALYGFVYAASFNIFAHVVHNCINYNKGFLAAVVKDRNKLLEDLRKRSLSILTILQDNITEINETGEIEFKKIDYMFDYVKKAKDISELKTVLKIPDGEIIFTTYAFIDDILVSISQRSDLRMKKNIKQLESIKSGINAIVEEINSNLELKPIERSRIALYNEYAGKLRESCEMLFQEVMESMDIALLGGLAYNEAEGEKENKNYHKVITSYLTSQKEIEFIYDSEYWKKVKKQIIEMYPKLANSSEQEWNNIRKLYAEIIEMNKGREYIVARFRERCESIPTFFRRSFQTLDNNENPEALSKIYETLLSEIMAVNERLGGNNMMIPEIPEIDEIQIKAIKKWQAAVWGQFEEFREARAALGDGWINDTSRWNTTERNNKQYIEFLNELKKEGKSDAEIRYRVGADRLNAYYLMNALAFRFQEKSETWAGYFLELEMNVDQTYYYYLSNSVYNKLVKCSITDEKLKDFKDIISYLQPVFESYFKDNDFSNKKTSDGFIDDILKIAKSDNIYAAVDQYKKELLRRDDSKHSSKTLSSKFVEKWFGRVHPQIRRRIIAPLLEAFVLVPIAILRVVWLKAGKFLTDWFVYRAHDNVDEADIIIRQQGMAWITAFTWIGLVVAILSPVLGISMPDFLVLQGNDITSILSFVWKSALFGAATGNVFVHFVHNIINYNKGFLSVRLKNTETNQISESDLMLNKLNEVLKSDTMTVEDINVFTFLRETAKTTLGPSFDPDRADHAILDIKAKILDGKLDLSTNQKTRLRQMLIKQAGEYFQITNGFGTIDYDMENDQLEDLVPREEKHEDILYASMQAIDTLGRMGEISAVKDLIEISRKGLDAHRDAVGLTEMQKRVENATKQLDKDGERRYSIEYSCNFEAIRRWMALENMLIKSISNLGLKAGDGKREYNEAINFLAQVHLDHEYRGEAYYWLRQQAGYRLSRDYTTQVSIDALKRASNSKDPAGAAPHPDTMFIEMNLEAANPNSLTIGLAAGTALLHIHRVRAGKDVSTNPENFDFSQKDYQFARLSGVLDVLRDQKIDVPTKVKILNKIAGIEDDKTVLTANFYLDAIEEIIKGQRNKYARIFTSQKVSEELSDPKVKQAALKAFIRIAEVVSFKIKAKNNKLYTEIKDDLSKLGKLDVVEGKSNLEFFRNVGRKVHVTLGNLHRLAELESFKQGEEYLDFNRKIVIGSGGGASRAMAGSVNQITEDPALSIIGFTDNGGATLLNRAYEACEQHTYEGGYGDHTRNMSEAAILEGVPGALMVDALLRYRTGPENKKLVAILNEQYPALIKSAKQSGPEHEKRFEEVFEQLLEIAERFDKSGMSTAFNSVKNMVMKGILYYTGGMDKEFMNPDGIYAAFEAYRRLVGASSMAIPDIPIGNEIVVNNLSGEEFIGQSFYSHTPKGYNPQKGKARMRTVLKMQDINNFYPEIAVRSRIMGVINRAKVLIFGLGSWGTSVGILLKNRSLVSAIADNPSKDKILIANPANDAETMGMSWMEQVKIFLKKIMGRYVWDVFKKVLGNGKSDLKRKVMEARPERGTVEQVYNGDFGGYTGVNTAQQDDMDELTSNGMEVACNADMAEIRLTPMRTNPDMYNANVAYVPELFAEGIWGLLSEDAKELLTPRDEVSIIKRRDKVEELLSNIGLSLLSLGMTDIHEIIYHPDLVKDFKAWLDNGDVPIWIREKSKDETMFQFTVRKAIKSTCGVEVKPQDITLGTAISAGRIGDKKIEVKFLAQAETDNIFEPERTSVDKEEEILTNEYLHRLGIIRAPPKGQDTVTIILPYELLETGSTLQQKIERINVALAFQLEKAKQLISNNFRDEANIHENVVIEYESEILKELSLAVPQLRYLRTYLSKGKVPSIMFDVDGAFTAARTPMAEKMSYYGYKFFGSEGILKCPVTAQDYEGPHKQIVEPVKQVIRRLEWIAELSGVPLQKDTEIWDTTTIGVSSGGAIFGYDEEKKEYVKLLQDSMNEFTLSFIELAARLTMPDVGYQVEGYQFEPREPQMLDDGRIVFAAAAIFPSGRYDVRRDWDPKPKCEKRWLQIHKMTTLLEKPRALLETIDSFPAVSDTAQWEIEVGNERIVIKEEEKEEIRNIHKRINNLLKMNKDFAGKLDMPIGISGQPGGDTTIDISPVGKGSRVNMVLGALSEKVSNGGIRYLKINEQAAPNSKGDRIPAIEQVIMQTIGVLPEDLAPSFLGDELFKRTIKHIVTKGNDFTVAEETEKGNIDVKLLLHNGDTGKGSETLPNTTTAYGEAALMPNVVDLIYAYSTMAVQKGSAYAQIILSPLTKRKINNVLRARKLTLEHFGIKNLENMNERQAQELLLLLNQPGIPLSTESTYRTWVKRIRESTKLQERLRKKGYNPENEVDVKQYIDKHISWWWELVTLQVFNLLFIKMHDNKNIGEVILRSLGWVLMHVVLGVVLYQIGVDVMAGDLAIFPAIGKVILGLGWNAGVHFILNRIPGFPAMSTAIDQKKVTSHDIFLDTISRRNRDIYPQIHTVEKVAGIIERRNELKQSGETNMQQSILRLTIQYLDLRDTAFELTKYNIPEMAEREKQLEKLGWAENEKSTQNENNIRKADLLSNGSLIIGASENQVKGMIDQRRDFGQNVGAMQRIDAEPQESHAAIDVPLGNSRNDTLINVKLVFDNGIIRYYIDADDMQTVENLEINALELETRIAFSIADDVNSMGLLRYLMPFMKIRDGSIWLIEYSADNPFIQKMNSIFANVRDAVKMPWLERDSGESSAVYKERLKQHMKANVGLHEVIKDTSKHGAKKAVNLVAELNPTAVTPYNNRGGVGTIYDAVRFAVESNFTKLVATGVDIYNINWDRIAREVKNSRNKEQLEKLLAELDEFRIDGDTIEQGELAKLKKLCYEIAEICYLSQDKRFKVNEKKVTSLVKAYNYRIDREKAGMILQIDEYWKNIVDQQKASTTEIELYTNLSSFKDVLDVNEETTDNEILSKAARGAAMRINMEDMMINGDREKFKDIFEQTMVAEDVILKYTPDKSSDGIARLRNASYDNSMGVIESLNIVFTLWPKSEVISEKVYCQRVKAEWQLITRPNFKQDDFKALTDMGDTLGIFDLQTDALSAAQTLKSRVSDWPVNATLKGMLIAKIDDMTAVIKNDIKLERSAQVFEVRLKGLKSGVKGLIGEAVRVIAGNKAASLHNIVMNEETREMAEYASDMVDKNKLKNLPAQIDPIKKTVMSVLNKEAGIPKSAGLKETWVYTTEMLLSMFGEYDRLPQGFDRIKQDMAFGAIHSFKQILVAG